MEIQLTDEEWEAYRKLIKVWSDSGARVNQIVSSAGINDYRIIRDAFDQEEKAKAAIKDFEGTLGNKEL